MATESFLTFGYGVLWASPGLFAPALFLLALERRLTRVRRQAGHPAPLAAYLLDALVVLALLAAVVGTALFVVSALVLGTRWVLDAAGRTMTTVLANPLLLAGVLVVCIGALVAVATARGWIGLPIARQRATPAGTVVATAAPAPQQERAAMTDSVTRLVGAPPPQDEPAADERRRMVRPRPSPTAQPKSRPWLRNTVRAAQSESPGQPASAPQAGAEPEFERSTGLAMLSPRRTPAGESIERREPAQRYSVSPGATGDGEQEPELAMLSQRRRLMNERGLQAAAPLVAPAPHLQASAVPAARPASSGWWHLPLGVTVVLVVALAVLLVIFGPPLSVDIAQLSSLREAVTRNTDNVASVVAAPTVVPSPASAQPGSDARPVATSIPAPSVTLRIATVTVDNLNVRALPGPDQQVVSLVKRGEQLELLGEEQSIEGSVWVRVRSGQLEGWVNRSYLEVQQP